MDITDMKKNFFLIHGFPLNDILGMEGYKSYKYTI